jgi:hypothetical protein
VERDQTLGGGGEAVFGVSAAMEAMAPDLIERSGELLTGIQIRIS